MTKSPTITFHGAARTVTGSCMEFEDGGQSILVDCGIFQGRDEDRRNREPFAFVPSGVDAVLLTHAHMDHCAAAGMLRQQLEVPIEGPHRDDQFWLDKLPEWCRMSGFPPADAFLPDRWLQQGDTVTVGEQVLKVLHCPGHTPGHVVFLYEPQRVAWVGDVLFQGSIGRTDFPRGNHEQLVASIRDRLFPLGDDITFIPGHGPTSTFGQERRSNPFVADSRYG